MKKEIMIEEFIKNLDVKIPDKEDFFQLSRIIPINPKRSDYFHINFERGMLLYALITKYRPKNILEIGTAEGYSTLCMAWAMSDNEIDGKIFTVDPKSHTEKIERKIKNRKNDDTVNMLLSTEELWEKFASPKWIEKIEVISGYSGEILKRKSFPSFDFCYVDGSHIYEAVKQDFFRVLKLVSKNFMILFDDYVPNQNDGAAKVIDEEIVDIFDTTFIKTNTKQQRIELKENSLDDLIMCLINSNSLKKSLWELYDEKEINNFLKTYEFTQKRLKIRKKLDKKIPFLKNIKFRSWK